VKVLEAKPVYRVARPNGALQIVDADLTAITCDTKELQILNSIAGIS
jgi:hypothetical protein